MTVKYIKSLLSVAAVGLLLTGCHNMLSLNVDRDKPLTPYQQCAELKRQMLFYTNDTNHNTQWSTPAKRLKYMQEYRQHDCDEVLKQTPHNWYD